jgi:hypothetical protein
VEEGEEEERGGEEEEERAEEELGRVHGCGACRIRGSPRPPVRVGWVVLLAVSDKAGCTAAGDGNRRRGA